MPTELFIINPETLTIHLFDFKKKLKLFLPTRYNKNSTSNEINNNCHSIGKKYATLFFYRLDPTLGLKLSQQSQLFYGVDC